MYVSCKDFFVVFVSSIRRPPLPSLFPYTTLFRSSIRVIGVEPAAADDAARSFRSGRIVPSVNPTTIADGLRSSLDRKSTRLNSSHRCISYVVFCLKTKRELLRFRLF